MNLKTYHTNITGVVGSPLRTAMGKQIGDHAMIPEIEKTLKLWKPDVTIDKLKQSKLDHFLPAKTARENLVKNIKRREIVSLMHSL
jgi:hypothetical protein